MDSLWPEFSREDAEYAKKFLSGGIKSKITIGKIEKAFSENNDQIAKYYCKQIPNYLEDAIKSKLWPLYDKILWSGIRCRRCNEQYSEYTQGLCAVC